MTMTASTCTSSCNTSLINDLDLSEDNCESENVAQQLNDRCSDDKNVAGQWKKENSSTKNQVDMNKRISLFKYDMGRGNKVFACVEEHDDNNIDADTDTNGTAKRRIIWKDHHNFNRRQRRFLTPIPWYCRKNFILFLLIVNILTIALLVSKLGHSTSNTSSPAIKVPIYTNNELIDQFVWEVLAPKYQAKLAEDIPNWHELLEKPTSPQGLALQWIRSVADEFVSLTELEQVQRFVLAVFYYSTYKVDHYYTVTNHIAEDWTSSLYWLSNKTECSWEGIICENVPVAGGGDPSAVVKAISLRENNLSGMIPYELAMIPTLVELDIGSNYIVMNGPETLNVLNHLSFLQGLVMPNNYMKTISGLPTQIRSLTNLETLQLSFNILQGTIDGAIFTSLQKLKFLDISSNFLSGTVPSELASLPNVTDIYANNNQFDFNFDDLLGGWNSTTSAKQVENGQTIIFPSLQQIVLDGNKVRGSIPTTIGLVSNLVGLSINNSTLTGSIPSEVGMLTNIETLSLYDNRLTGTIPREIPTSINDLQLHWNNFGNCSVPASVCMNATNATTASGSRTVTADCTTNDKLICECCTQCY